MQLIYGHARYSLHQQAPILNERERERIGLQQNLHFWKCSFVAAHAMLARQ